MTTAETKPRVALFVTCLVDLVRPSIGFAAAALLDNAGFEVCVPSQGCCGQPNFNGGDRSGAREIARQVIETFEPFDYVIAPSGSCAAMIRRHYPALFDADSEEAAAACSLADKTWELASFLHDIAGFEAKGPALMAKATYHDGCSGLRELGIRDQPRALLAGVGGLELTELAQPELCCGFGGLFCVKYPEISGEIGGRKCRDIVDTRADFVIAGELGCLLQIEGRLRRDGSDVRAVHFAEVLAGTVDTD